MGLRRAWWCWLLWCRDELRSFCAESAALLHYRLIDWRYIVVEEEVVGAGGLGERVYGGVAVGRIVGHVDGLECIALVGNAQSKEHVILQVVLAQLVQVRLLLVVLAQTSLRPL